MNQPQPPTKPITIIDLEKQYNVEIEQFFNPVTFEWMDYWCAKDEGKIIAFVTGNWTHIYLSEFDLPIYLENYKRRKVSQWN